ncbi:MAG: hypothetical protein HC794_09120 [Nitrospiraceae bacterium]|nr:hypothetical protein [Nitrospiraceae bacterium]
MVHGLIWDPTVVPEYDTTNSTVWTGKELFIWSGTCSRPAVGARYQPPAM